MSDRLRNWIRMQQRLVDDGIKASHLRLDGPDDTTWGTWPIDTDQIAEIVEQQLTAWGEELPKGSHSARLVALDPAGKQTALLPQTIHGSSSVAKSAGNEALLHSRAHAASVATSERQLEAMGNRAVQMEERALNMLSSVIELGGVVCGMQRQAVEEDCRRVEATARAESMVRVADGLAKNAEPLVALLIAHLTDKLQDRDEKKQAGKQAQPQASAEGKETDTDAKPEPPAANPEPRPDRPQTVPSNGGRRATANGGRPAKRSRKRTAPRPTTKNKDKRP